MDDGNSPHHAHVYYTPEQRPAAEALRATFLAWARNGEVPPIAYVGAMAEGPIGPHPQPQYELHFAASAVPRVAAAIEAAGLRALIHPLTDDDLADHTTLAHWIGEPLALDLTALDPPGENQGVARFGKADF